MLFAETTVAGGFAIALEPVQDERGFFARSWCRQQLASRGLCDRVVQINTALNPREGTLRGLHYQEAPFCEVKVVSCNRGAIFDVLVDLRPQSATFLKWHGEILSADNFRALYVPEGCAHGYLTLESDSVVTYLTSESYVPTAARGVRFDDRAFGIEWPREVRVISAADRGWPDFPQKGTHP